MNPAAVRMSICCVLLGRLLSASDAPAPAAIVLSVQGIVKASMDEGPDRPVSLFDLLPDGTRVTTAAGASVRLALFNGERVELSGESAVTIAAGAFRSPSGAARSLPRLEVMPRIARIVRGEKPGMRQGTIRVRAPKSGTDGPQVLYPAWGAAVQSDEAILRFRPKQGIKKYRIDIEDASGRPVRGFATSSTLVDPPHGTLLPGREYYWSVRSDQNEDPLAEGVFRTLNPEESDLWLSVARRQRKSDDPDLRMIRIHVGQKLGLIREACASISELLEAPSPPRGIQALWESQECAALLAIGRESPLR